MNGPVCRFGQRWGRLHAGVDIAVGGGTPIARLMPDGSMLIGSVGGYGTNSCVQHSGSLSFCYAHQSSFSTSNGASVAQGQVIGNVGCTGHCFGDHLHFETRLNGSPVDPMGFSRAKRPRRLLSQLALWRRTPRPPARCPGFR